LSIRSAEYQFWDTSALVALILQERHTALSLQAKEEGRRFLAWDWLKIEALAALARRKCGAVEFKSLRTLLEQFEFIGLEPSDYPALGKVIQKHKLRSADAGHLFCLRQAKKLRPSICFVCFDEELTKAAEAEGIHVFS
jgi:predicted nucleic acid-binding protein